MHYIACIPCIFILKVHLITCCYTSRPEKEIIKNLTHHLYDYYIHVLDVQSQLKLYEATSWLTEYIQQRFTSQVHKNGHVIHK